MRERGVAIVYISHRLDEVYALGDRIAVLRDGCSLGTHEPAELGREKLIELMVDIADARRQGHQFELVSRLFFDFEALRFGGFVPAVHAGFDLFYLSLPGEAARVAPVWVFGAGVRRVAF